MVGWLPVSAQNSGPQIQPVTELDESIFPPPTARQHIGHGRMFTNDFLADRGDRWRTGSYMGSRVWAWDPWQGRAPGTFGDLLELKFGGQIMTPEHLRIYVPTDRPWAGQLFGGVHTHWTAGAYEMNLGGEIVLVGPQTQLDHLQEVLHDIFSAPIPSTAVLANQIGNQVWPVVTGEIGRDFALGQIGRVRPFAEFRAGDESYVRVGADLTIGMFGVGDLMSRETISGNRYRIAKTEAPGMSFVLGADTAKVLDSIYLPSSRGFNLTDTRDRVRAGVHWQGEGRSVFYGATWLGREFVGQREPQVVGSVRLQFQF
ncbi:MAG: lipid A-modifier LpxR family protein [Paracoccaceae bacterium]